jgi:hypothetical protein
MLITFRTGTEEKQHPEMRFDASHLSAVEYKHANLTFGWHFS